MRCMHADSSRQPTVTQGPAVPVYISLQSTAAAAVWPKQSRIYSWLLLSAKSSGCAWPSLPDLAFVICQLPFENSFVGVCLTIGAQACICMCLVSTRQQAGANDDEQSILPQMHGWLVTDIDFLEQPVAGGMSASPPSAFQPSTRSNRSEIVQGRHLAHCVDRAIEDQHWSAHKLAISSVTAGRAALRPAETCAGIT